MERLLRRQRDAIAQMFSTIAPRYDLLNHLLSFGMDLRWRQFAVQWLPMSAKVIVDIGTGTGDFAFAALRRCPDAKVIGVDLSLPMLRLAQSKAVVEQRSRCVWLVGDGLQLPLPDRCADGVLAAFVIRNFSDLRQGLREMVRVLKPGGVALLLEFCQPPEAWWHTPAGLFVRYVVPCLGRCLGDSVAYAYLAASIRTFLPVDAITNLMREVGFQRADGVPLSFGVATLLRGVR